MEPGSPAARGGLQPGDVVVGFNNRTVDLPRDLAEAVGEAKPGSEARVAVLRDGGQRTEQTVTVGQPKNGQVAGRGDGSGAEEGQQPSLGLALAPNGRGGAVVAGVEPGSVAAERGLQPGDVILRAGDRAVANPRDVADAVKTARQAGRAAIALQLDREGSRTILALPLKQG